MRYNRWALWTGLALMTTVCVGGVLIALGDNPLTRVDNAVFDATSAQQHLAAMRVVQYVSNLFGPVTVSVVTAVAVLALVVRDRDLRRAGVIGGAVVLGGAACEVLKLLVSRPRPPYVGQLDVETGMSYPSGHVTGSTALLVALAVVLTGYASTTARRLAVAGSFALAVLVAASRVYLEVHWVSDVLAGLLVGTAAAMTAMVVVPTMLALIERRIKIPLTRDNPSPREGIVRVDRDSASSVGF